MTDQSMRHTIFKLIAEGKDKGLSKSAICDAFGYDIRTIQRWEKEDRADGRKGSSRHIPHKMTEKEIQTILETVNLPEYRGQCPAEFVAIYAEKGQYIGSERTISRVLKNAGQLTHRGPGKASRSRRARPTLTATGPNQVYSWDITYLLTNVRGIYFYLYLIMDIWSRKIVAWEIHSEENSVLSAAMMERLSKEVNLKGITLHADNGGPMKGANMLAKLYDLGVLASFSRPRVSEDNPYSESLFKTLKYRPGYPKCFQSLDDANNWVANFVHWYNHEHRHSGILHVTPEQRHKGIDKSVLATRRETFMNARDAHPERWSGEPKSWDAIPIVSLGVKHVA